MLLLVMLVKKLGGGVRICVDYRGINNIILKTKYFLLFIKETLDVIYKVKIFIKLDVIAAFNKIRIYKGYK